MSVPVTLVFLHNVYIGEGMVSEQPHTSGNVGRRRKNTRVTLETKAPQARDLGFSMIEM